MRPAVDTALDHGLQPSSQRGVALRQRRQCCSGPVDEQGAQIGVAALGDAQQPRLAASGMLPGNQAEPSPKIPGFGDAACVAHRRDQRRCVQNPDAEHLFGNQQGSMGGKFVRTIGIVRAAVKIGMQNLAYNMRRLVVLERIAVATG